MTDCTGRPAELFLEAYLQGSLPEAEAEAFEEHYFNCSLCLAQVEALQAVAAKLASQPREFAKKPLGWPIRAGIWGAIAAMLAIGFVGLRMKRQPTQSLGKGPATTLPQSVSAVPTTTVASASVTRLADMTLPVFQAPHLRGENSDPHFETGMKAYGARNYLMAINDLLLVPAQDRDALAAQFYIGVCQMREGNLEAATTSLRSVSEAGNSLQQEAAFYYLAQVAFARDDATTARHYLARTISLHGDYEKRAHNQLANALATSSTN